MRSSPATGALLAIVLAVALVVAACGGSDTGACTEVREPEDPQSARHVLEPEGLAFTSHPPTSGPHLAVPPATGLLAEPLAPLLQVTALEAGRAVVQHDGLDATALAAVQALAGPDVVVAPGEDLPASLVVTAWTWKLTCDGFGDDEAVAVADFIASRPASAPGSDF